MAKKITQLEEQIQNELCSCNELLDLISKEMKEIKEITHPGGEFHNNINMNISLTESLAKIQHINFNIPKVPQYQMDLDLSNDNNQNLSYQEHSVRESTDADETM